MDHIYKLKYEATQIIRQSQVLISIVSQGERVSATFHYTKQKDRVLNRLASKLIDCIFAVVGPIDSLFISFKNLGDCVVQFQYAVIEIHMLKSLQMVMYQSPSKYLDTTLTR